MRDTESDLALSCNQARLPVAGQACICLIFWLSFPHGNPKQAGMKTEGCSMQNGYVGPLRRTTSTQFIEHGAVT